MPDFDHRPTARPVSEVEFKLVREQARQLLRRLMADRILSEERAADREADDMLKTVTGQSAMDNAVRATRDMIRYLEETPDARRPGPELYPAGRAAG